MALISPRKEYAIIVGSQRPQSQSKKVAAYIAREMLHGPAVSHVHMLDLEVNRLRLWDESEVLSAPATYPEWYQWEPILRGCDGFVLVVPEWDGMVPPTVKNFIQHCTRDLVGHKPCLIVGVSSSGGAAAPIAELRMTGYKNCRFCFIPEHVVVRNVESVLNGAEPSSESDQRLRLRIKWAMEILCSYADALAPMRQHTALFAEEYPYGM